VAATEPLLDGTDGQAPLTPATEIPLPAAPRVIDAPSAHIMNPILHSVTTQATGRAISLTSTCSVQRGKTGPTNDNKDLWFSGFNHDIETTVYVGYDQPDNLGRDEQAATVALPIWIDYMKQALEGRPESTMEQPDGLVTVRINRQSGLRAAPGEPNTIFEIFKEEEIPPYAANTNNSRPGAPQGQSGPVDSIF